MKTTTGIPRATDPRAELFFLLGQLSGLAVVDTAARITELVIELTSETATSEDE